MTNKKDLEKRVQELEKRVKELEEVIIKASKEFGVESMITLRDAISKFPTKESQQIAESEDGMKIEFKKHTNWERGHPMLDGMCFKCGFDEKTCNCKEPDIQNPRSENTEDECKEEGFAKQTDMDSKLPEDPPDIEEEVDSPLKGHWKCINGKWIRKEDCPWCGEDSEECKENEWKKCECGKEWWGRDNQHKCKENIEENGYIKEYGGYRDEGTSEVPEEKEATKLDLIELQNISLRKRIEKLEALHKGDL